MAKVKFGAIATDVRNKIGGIVYSKNQYGSYVRTKVSPVQPQTNYQRAVRDSFKALSVAWANTLTTAQRAAWAAFAADHKVTDVFGASLQLSGLSMYQRVNRILAQCSIARIDDPPADMAVIQLVTCSVVADASDSTIAITFTATPLPANTHLYVWCTPPLPAGVNFIKNRLRQTWVSAAALASPGAAGATYELRFPNLVAGQKIGILVSTVNDLNGAVSQGLQSIVTVQA
jgi:hypothetical protein